MTQLDLDKKELISHVLENVRLVAGLDSAMQSSLPRRLGKSWQVFQIPSSTQPNYSYYVFGSQRSGWTCSCVGHQAHGHCKHADTVAAMWKVVAQEKASRRRKGRRR